MPNLLGNATIGEQRIKHLQQGELNRRRSVNLNKSSDGLFWT